MRGNIVLSERLAAAALFVPRGSSAADIGTDHGYIPIWLVQNDVCRSVIASDIGALPLEHAKRSAAEYGEAENIDFRLCAGLDGIRSDEADTIIIAGMGGETIAAILAAAPWTGDGAHLLILQPMTKIPFLRAWLAENGYRFENEKLVWENNGYFPVMAVRGGEPCGLSEAEIYGGVKLDADPLLLPSLDREIEKLRRAAEGLAMSDSLKNAERLEKIRGTIAALEEKRGALSCRR